MKFVLKSCVLAVCFTSLISPLFSAEPAAQKILGLNSYGEKSAEGLTDFTLQLRPRGTVKAMMLFVRFPDAELKETTENLYERLVPKAVDYFEKDSYGLVHLKVDARHRWLDMDHPSTWYEKHESYVPEAIAKIGKDVNFNDYDILYVVASKNPGTPMSPAMSARPGEGFKLAGDAGGKKEMRFVVTFGNDIRRDNWGWQTLAHETSHLFGLPDLYSFEQEKRRRIRWGFVGSWDVMGVQVWGSQHLAWQKFKLGFLTEDDFNFLDHGDATFVISPIEKPGGKKAIVIPVSSDEAYVLEVRSRPDLEKSEPGVLLYVVSTAIDTGLGPIRIKPAAPDDDEPAGDEMFVPLKKALYHDGVVLDDSQRGIRAIIAGRVGSGYRIHVSRKEPAKADARHLPSALPPLAGLDLDYALPAAEREAIAAKAKALKKPDSGSK